MSANHKSVSPRREKILQALQEAGGSLPIGEIVERTGLEYGNVRTAMSEMTTMKLVARVHRGVYDLPERVTRRKMTSKSHPLRKILQNQQILKVLLNSVVTNKALMEALLLGQQEIIRALRNLGAAGDGGDEAIKDLEEVFADRVKWHFDVAAQQVVENYTKLPPEVLDVLVAPLARGKDKIALGEGPRLGSAGKRKGDRPVSKRANQ